MGRSEARRGPARLPRLVRSAGRGTCPRPDRATHRHRTVMPLFSKSACAIVPHSETQSFFTSPGHGGAARRLLFSLVTSFLIRPWRVALIYDGVNFRYAG